VRCPSEAESSCPEGRPLSESYTGPATDLRGVDISVYQHPDSIDWDALAKTHDFVICRSCYGTSLDRHVISHVERVRDAALTLGLYHFWTEPHENDQQLRAFDSIAKVVRLSTGDIIPAVDVEDHGFRKNQPPKYPVRPDWGPRLHAFITALAAQYGRCMVYCTQRDWKRLGEPDWLLEYPLWVAHWTEGLKPATPGDRPWAVWQHKVGPLPGIYSRPIDQNRARRPLPIIGDNNWLAAHKRKHIEGQIALTIDQAVRERKT
jgi:GH25 family lysozyme M1 (1,4-beta-N-acetylmuramidase)